MLVDVPGEHHSLVLKDLYILYPNPLSLSCNTVTKGKIFNVGLLGLNLNLSIVHFFLQSILLSLQVLFSLHRHAHLSKLKDNFEQGEERDHVCRQASISDARQKSSLFLICVHIDLLSNILDKWLVEDGWVGLFAGRSESLIGRKNVISLGIIGSIRRASDEFADQVKKGLSGSDGW